MSVQGNGTHSNGTLVVESPNGSSAEPEPAPAQTWRRKWLGVNIEGRDPRYLALRNFAASLTIFNILGFLWLGFEQPWLWPFLSAGTAYAVEMILETLAAWAYRRPAGYRGNGLRGLIVFLLPAHITGVAFNFLMYAADQFLPIMFGITVAVGTKWVLRAKVNGKVKHFMNPSNFGIVVALLVFPTIAVVGPYHFVENVSGPADALIVLGLLGAGTMLNAKLTKKTPLIMAWLGAYVLQAVVRGLLDSNISIIAALLPMTGIAFVLYTNYMITDPATTPFAKRDQIIFGASVGLMYGVLMALHVSFGLFFALVIVCASRGLFWWSRNIREWLANRATVVVVDVQETAPEPDELAAVEPGEPVVAESDEPVAQPVAVESAEPVAAESGELVAVESGDPVAVESGDPVAVESGDPVAVESGEPVAAESGELVAVESGDPVAVESGDPAVVESGEPVVSESDEPAVAESGESVAVESDDPAVVESGDPVEVEPEKEPARSS
ncbi:enediyne biosynthesis protein [Nocardia sp. NPDC049526]|uniref:enediyne biosynthesis protein n=1 Tax=Nocardia sp. NPDC049526 TaxID=3364316 RepID=UPI0037B9846C